MPSCHHSLNCCTQDRAKSTMTLRNPANQTSFSCMLEAKVPKKFPSTSRMNTWSRGKCNSNCDIDEINLVQFPLVKHHKSRLTMNNKLRNIYPHHTEKYRAHFNTMCTSHYSSDARGEYDRLIVVVFVDDSVVTGLLYLVQLVATSTQDVFNMGTVTRTTSIYRTNLSLLYFVIIENVLTRQSTVLTQHHKGKVGRLHIPPRDHNSVLPL